MAKKLCNCGANRENHQSCPTFCSNYKMVFLLRDRKSPFKKRDTSGDLVNPVVWSFLKEDKRPVHVIKKNMLARLSKRPEYQASNFIGFYHRDGREIEIIPV